MGVRGFIICTRCEQRRVHGVNGMCISCYRTMRKATKLGRPIPLRGPYKQRQKFILVKVST